MNTIEGTTETVATPRPTVTRDEICQVLTEKRTMFLGLIKRVVSDSEIAQEILSQVTIQALTKAETDFRGESSLSTYIGSIAYNAACRYARRQTTRKSAGVFYDHELSMPDDSDDFEPLEAASEETHVSVDTVVEHRRLLAQVEEVLAELEQRMPNAYECWKMHRLQGMPYEDIERQLGVNRVTARTRVHKFTNALIKRMGVEPSELFR